MGVYFIIICSLILLDLLFMLIFPKFYAFFGIPYSKLSFEIKPSVDLNNKFNAIKEGPLKDLLIRNNVTELWFRNRYNLLNLYSLAIIFFCKGVISVSDNRASITLIVNNYTTIFLLMILSLPLIAKIDTLGIVFMVIFFILICGLTYLRFKSFSKIVVRIKDILVA